jgi:hypothetical protein
MCTCRSASKSRLCVRLARSTRRSYERSFRLDDVLKDGRGAEHSTRAEGAPRQLTVLTHERVEAGEVLVETEHVRDRPRERVASTLADGAGDGLDPELAPALRQPNGARAAAQRQGRLERARLEVETIGRQLGDAMRHDRAREIDGLAAGATKWEVSDESQGVQACTPGCKLSAMSAVTYRRLVPADLARIGEIDRTERINALHVQDGDRLEQRVGDFSASAWFGEGEGEHSVAHQRAACEGHLVAGGTRTGSVREWANVGIGIVRSHIRPGIAQFAYLHVSSEHRAHGIGTSERSSNAWLGSGATQ